METQSCDFWHREGAGAPDCSHRRELPCPLGLAVCRKICPFFVSQEIPPNFL